jgi:TRAP-type mannitol/chloroaromatic compound transport system permease large subunit
LESATLFCRNEKKVVGLKTGRYRHFNLTWFGLIMLLALEIGYTTPPFGLLLFVMKGVAPPGTTMLDVYKAAAPFIACSLLLIGMILLFPPLATWLPTLLMVTL